MIPVKNLFVRYRVVNNRSYLVNKGEAFILDEVGIAVWGNVDGENSIEDIVAKIAKLYNQNPEEIKSDINDYIKELEKSDLVKIG